MTAIKLDTKFATRAEESLGRHAAALYANPGARRVGVVEIAHVERTQPAPDEDKEASVKLRITHFEVATPEQEDALREGLRALYLARTAQGTLDDAGEVELSEKTLGMLGERLWDLEAARLRVAVQHWRDEASAALGNSKAGAADYRKALESLRKGLGQALGHATTA